MRQPLTHCDQKSRPRLLQHEGEIRQQENLGTPNSGRGRRWASKPSISLVIHRPPPEKPPRPTALKEPTKGFPAIHAEDKISEASRIQGMIKQPEAYRYSGTEYQLPENSR